MSKKYEDGIWLFKGTEGYTRVRFLKDGHCSIMLSEGELQAPYPLDLLPWTPIRRVADLEGRPVVEASVIEALAKDISETENQLLDTSLLIEVLTAILHDRLAARKDENNDEVAALNARIAEPAERPIVNFPGAFVCWCKSGEKYTAWRTSNATTGCPMRTVRHGDGFSEIWSDAEFDQEMTRQPPLTLPPEQERLVGPIAAYFQVDESEARKALATCAGG